VAWIQRTEGTSAPGRSDVGPAKFYRLMRGCAEHLEQMADYRVTRLTDLAPLIERLSK